MHTFSTYGLYMLDEPQRIDTGYIQYLIEHQLPTSLDHPLTTIIVHRLYEQYKSDVEYLLRMPTLGPWLEHISWSKNFANICPIWAKQLDRKPKFYTFIDEAGSWFRESIEEQRDQMLKDTDSPLVLAHIVYGFDLSEQDSLAQRWNRQAQLQQNMPFHQWTEPYTDWVILYRKTGFNKLFYYASSKHIQTDPKHAIEAAQNWLAIQSDPFLLASALVEKGVDVKKFDLELLQQALVIGITQALRNIVWKLVLITYP